MKIYYYLLFRIYRFYKDVLKEKQTPLSYTSAVSTLLVGFNIITIHGILKYNSWIASIPNKYYFLGIAFTCWFFNHYFIVKKKKFLEYNFKKDFIGGALIVCYILITAVSAIVVGNYNREKTIQEKEQQQTEQKFFLEERYLQYNGYDFWN